MKDFGGNAKLDKPSCKLHKSCMVFVPGLISLTINRRGSARLALASKGPLPTKSHALCITSHRHSIRNLGVGLETLLQFIGGQG